MAYFLPSFLQKRILRYALSRLDLLDTEALDLEKLDITWGKKCTIELRDVAIRAERLAVLLHLPEYLIVCSATVVCLRLTVPADLYQSGILAEVHGIDLRFHANLEDKGRGDKGRKRSSSRPRRHAGKSGGINANRRARAQSNADNHVSGHGTQKSEPSSGRDDQQVSSSEYLPTTIDLAQSFLQTEPKEEKAKLEATIAPRQRTHDSPMSDNDSDEKTGLGVGSTISLPGFLADFLKGVGDRIQLKIRDVQLNLDLKLSLSPEEFTGSDTSYKPENVTIRISIDELLVDEVTNNVSMRSGPLPLANGKGYSRRVSLRKIQAMLISDSTLLNNIARSSSSSSPESVHTSTVASSKSRASEPSLSPTSLKASHVQDDVSAQESPQTSRMSISQTSRGMYGISEDQEDRNRSPLLMQPLTIFGNNYQESMSSDSFHSSQGAKSTDEIEQSIASDASIYRDAEDYDASPHASQNSLRPMVHEWRGEVSLSSSEYDSHPPRPPDIATDMPGLTQNPGVVSLTQRAAPLTERAHSVSSHDASSPEDNSSESGLEDLTQSKLFSHGEASSLYTSALHQLEEQNRTIPGEWKSFSSEVAITHKPSVMPNETLLASFCETEIPQDSSTVNQAKSQEKSNRIDREGSADRGGFPGHLKVGTPSASAAKNGLSFQAEQSSGYLNRSAQQAETSSADLNHPKSMIKKLLTISAISLQLPQDASAATEASDELLSRTSVAIDISREAFASDSGPYVVGSTKTNVSTNKPPAQTSTRNSQIKQTTAVEIGNVDMVGDIALTKMTILILEKLIAMYSTQSMKGHDNNCQSSAVRSKPMQLSLRSVSWKFFDHVKGEPLVHVQASKLRHQAEPPAHGSDVLLRAEIQNLEFENRLVRDSSISTVSIRKFRCGYANDNILSFHAGEKMGKSSRDILAPVDNDILLSITKSADTCKVELTTPPLLIDFDIGRLDETLGWFGGLSSMLGLGGSMMSTVTALDAQRTMPGPLKAARGVHFETPATGEVAQGASIQSQSKITARVGGLILHLQGTETSLHLETTAMKMVSRIEGIGLQIDQLRMTGPYPRSSEAKPSMTVNISNIRIEYLSTPKEVDLTRLLALLSPSNDKDGIDDDILLDTLLRQRRQGAVLRATTERLQIKLNDWGDIQCFQRLADDVNKLSTVAKYLPQDDRPGLLILAIVREAKLEVLVNEAFGLVELVCEDIELANVTFPGLLALSIKSLQLERNGNEELVGGAIHSKWQSSSHLPMVMARFIGNEMEPIAKLSIHRARLEYHVSTVMAILGLDDEASSETMVSGVVDSVATLTGRRTSAFNLQTSKQAGSSVENSWPPSKTLQLDLNLRDCIIGLNPRNSLAKGLVVLTDCHFLGAVPKGECASMESTVNKASIMVINDHHLISDAQTPNLHRRQDDKLPDSQTRLLTETGFVLVSLISAAKATLQIVKSDAEKQSSIDIEIRDDLFVLETCADSTQTLQDILTGLKPPMPPSTEVKYRTEIVPVEDMLASLSGNAYTTQNVAQAGHEVSHSAEEEEQVGQNSVLDEVSSHSESVGYFYEPDSDSDSVYDGIADAEAEGMLEDDLEHLASSSVLEGIEDADLSPGFSERDGFTPAKAPLDFQEEHFGVGSTVEGTAHRWNIEHNTYGLSNETVLKESPLRVRVRDVHFIWNMFDGYDWQQTRDTISQAVANVQSKAADRLSRKDKRLSLEQKEEEEDVIGDFLFNSIYIGIPANRDPSELARQINRNFDDVASETESHTTSAKPESPNRSSSSPHVKSRRLRLQRSKYHKMTFELKGISADFVVFPPGSGETQSSIDIRVKDLDIFDHVPTSTWKKFATYMHDAGERESGTSMVHLEILNVKPVPNLAASEASILPLRLHVDQDALDFMTRFFEFKSDSTQAPTPKSEAPFLQRVEVNSVRVRLDFKPKRVDYAGIRSGHTNEFMNFFILDRADMVMRHVIIYGVSGFDKLGKTLNDIWMPDIKHNQLPGILAGLAPVRSLVNVGGGVRDLVIVPIREYQKNGKVIRSFQKGALAFAKTTTSELVKLGAKLAIGTQTVLQGAEDLLGQPPQRRPDVAGGWEDAELDEQEKKQISLYADQPVGVVQGLRGAYASLERDLLTAKDVIIAMPGEILESGSANEAARAVLRGAPTVILRPAMGISKAVGQTLMGATNSLDPANRRRIEDKYKKH